jgi:hypothetical protein
LLIALFYNKPNFTSMAKKAKKRVHHRRRRIGAASGMGAILQKTAGIVAGAAGGFFLNQALKSAFTSLPSFAPGVVILGGGVFLDKTMGKKSELISGAAEGLIAAGGLIALNETFISLPGISGVGFVTNYDKSHKMKPALNRAMGAPGFMDNSIGTVRDIATIAGVNGTFVGAVFDN